MHASIARARSLLRRQPRSVQIEIDQDSTISTEACSWDDLRAVYEEQAARGIPEAVEGLERIKQGRWPSSGRPRLP